MINVATKVEIKTNWSIKKLVNFTEVIKWNKIHTDANIILKVYVQYYFLCHQLIGWGILCCICNPIVKK